MSLKTINQRRHELQTELHRLIEQFQRLPECRGVQVQHIQIHQTDWHNGHDPDNPGVPNPEFASGPDVGYRVSQVSVILVLK